LKRGGSATLGSRGVRSIGNEQRTAVWHGRWPRLPHTLSTQSDSTRINISQQVLSYLYIRDPIDSKRLLSASADPSADIVQPEEEVISCRAYTASIHSGGVF